LGGLGLWQTLLTLLVFGLTFALGNSLLPQARRDMYLAVRAENFLLSDYELKRRKEGWLANQLAVLLPRLERIMDLSGYGVNLKRMLAMMGNTKGLELVLAEQITKAGLFAGCMLVVPFLTGSKVYFLLVPVAFIVLMLIQNREIYRKYKKWQNEIIKDIPLLIDKIQISMEAGKPLLHALQQVYKSASPRLRIMLERLLLDMQIMKQTEAIDKFARATGIPEMIIFAAAVKIAIENGYEKSKSNFEILKQDIRRLRIISLNELTRNKPQNLRKLQILMAINAALAMVYTFYMIFTEANKAL
jgi:Flp pilus assembly protein TadB